MNKLTEQEKLMYGAMGAIAGGDVPVIYRGAMITKLILQENGFGDFVRETQDIDASWAGGNSPPMEQLTAMLNRALGGKGLKAVATRGHGEKMSACYDIVDSVNGELRMTMDIDMRTAVDSRTYHYGSATFRGVTPDNVIADKVSVVASDKVFRRAKDLIDLYALLHCVTVKSTDIQAIWERESREIGAFGAFINRQDELRHSYEKLRRVDSKPEFGAVYGYLAGFLEPFVNPKADARVWDFRKSVWNAGGAPAHDDHDTLFG